MRAQEVAVSFNMVRDVGGGKNPKDNQLHGTARSSTRYYLPLRNLDFLHRDQDIPPQNFT
jgi:hypothetical protein